MKIGILGAGSWAIALATLLRKNDHEITLWEYNPDEAKMLKEKREHPLKLPGIILKDDILVTNDISEALIRADIVVCAVPSQTMRASIKSVVRTLDKDSILAIKGWVIVSKGIEWGTLKLMNEILLDELPDVGKDRICVLSGPSHAEEVSRDIPTSVVAASESDELAVMIQKAFSTNTFRIYTNSDIVGVELAASVKNVIALSAGICDGLGLGDNTKGALLTRGLVEMTRLGIALGAREETFRGLAGIGDLITTCMSKHSRNRRFGNLIGQGCNLDQALSQMVMVAEGVETTRSVHELSKKIGIEMPITEQVYLAIFEGKSPQKAVRDLMMREQKSE